MTRTRPRPISLNLKLSHEVALFSTPFIKLHDNLCSLEYVVKLSWVLTTAFSSFISKDDDDDPVSIGSAAGSKGHGKEGEDMCMWIHDSLKL